MIGSCLAWKSPVNNEGLISARTKVKAFLHVLRSRDWNKQRQRNTRKRDLTKTQIIPNENSAVPPWWSTLRCSHSDLGHLEKSEAGTISTSPICLVKLFL